MQIEGETPREENAFEIVYNARSSRASRSRKSSFQMSEKERLKPKVKKLRKMTLNPESIRDQQIQLLKERQRNYKGPGSVKGEIKEQEFDIDDFLELGGPQRVQSQKEQILESGIYFGMINERDLDSDFDLSGSMQLINWLNFQMGGEDDIIKLMVLNTY